MDQSEGSNCQEDIDEFLLTLDSLPNSNTNALFVPQPSPYVSLISNLPDSVRNILSLCSFQTEFQIEPNLEHVECDENEFSLAESNVLAYIGGYIIRKLRNKVCDVCVTHLVQNSSEISMDDENDHDQNLMFIRMKKYVGAKDGLILPSKSLLDVLLAMEKVYRSLIDEFMYSENVKVNLVSTISKKVTFGDLECDVCKSHSAIVHLMVTIRLHHTIKLANRSLMNDKSRRNRKVLKFSHL